MASGFYLVGRPRGRTVDCKPSFRAAERTQALSSRGQPRWAQRRTAASSSSDSGWLTRSTQFGDRGIGQRVAEQFDLLPLQSSPENLLECEVIGVFVKDRRAKIPPIQGVVEPARFVSSFRSWPLHRLTHPPNPGKRPFCLPPSTRMQKQLEIRRLL